MIWLALAAIALILIGIALSQRGATFRQSQGLSKGETLALDTKTYYSARYDLAGRPDRIFLDGEATIPEEWKSSRRVYDSHRTQLATYFILIAEETGIEPPYGVIVLGDKSRVTVKNTPELRQWVLEIADQIRASRQEIEKPIPVRQPAAKCRACGMREACGQRTV